MFNLGLPELLVIGMAALLVFGPKRLPELAKGLGKGIRDFKKALEGEEEAKPQDSAAHQQDSAAKQQEPALTGAEPRVKESVSQATPQQTAMGREPVAQS